MNAKVEEANMVAGILDPSRIAPLRRGPLCQRTRDPKTPWRIRAGVALRLMISLLLLAGIVMAGGL
jgi:hypothetical protein